jgi:hypothetical protein
VQKRGHVAAAAERAIYFAEEKSWLGCRSEQRKKTEQKTRRFVALARIEFIDVSVLVPTEELWAAAWQSGNLADWRVNLNVPKQTVPGRNTMSERLPAVTTVSQARIVYMLHGIRTLAEWQKKFSDVALVYDWKCRLDRWSFGKFSLLAFLNPWAREAKLEWFRKQYEAEANDKDVGIDTEHAPSIVAHSFGTYILGYSLLRFDFIRFNKVIVCGSILPVGFPWDKLIERGQVQAVRNEFGVRDFWVRCAGALVKGAGSSGAEGFTCKHERLVQEKFDYQHSQYFGKDHMRDRWIPFLERDMEVLQRVEGLSVEKPTAKLPIGLYLVLGVVIVALVVLALCVGNCLMKGRDAVAESGLVRSDISYTDEVELMGAAVRSGDWTSARDAMEKEVEWRGFIASSEPPGYFIQPRMEKPRNKWEKAFVMLAARRKHPAYSIGSPVTVRGMVSKLEPDGITIVGATMMSE